MGKSGIAGKIWVTLICIALCIPLFVIACIFDTLTCCGMNFRARNLELNQNKSENDINRILSKSMDDEA